MKEFPSISDSYHEIFSPVAESMTLCQMCHFAKAHNKAIGYGNADD
jgi:hypothetical protein